MHKLKRTTIAAFTLSIAILGLAGCSDPSYTVTGDNSKEIEQYTANREHATAFLIKTIGSVGEIKDMKSLPVGADLPALSRKMLELKSEGDVFGNVVSPLSHCRGVGYDAQKYWAVVSGQIGTETPEAALAAFLETAQSCQSQIDNGPVATTYIETALDKTPPVAECLKVISLGSAEKMQSWSCPTGLLSQG